MLLTPLPPAAGFVAFCRQACVDAWLDDDPHELVDPVIGVAGGPPWCRHCHHCGARCWTGQTCPLCPNCAAGRWSVTSQAARFAAELGGHDLTVLADTAWAAARQMCQAGLPPTFAAHIVLLRHHR